MTPEELQAKLATLEAEKAELATAKEASDKKAADQAKELAQLKKEKQAAAPVTFTVEKAGSSGKGHDWEAGTYEFTCPKFTHQKGSEFIEVDVREMDGSEDAKVRQLFNEIKAELVASGSGIVRFIEPNED